MKDIFVPEKVEQASRLLVFPKSKRNARKSLPPIENRCNGCEATARLAKSRIENSRGFSLIELLVVMAIMMLLLSLAAPAFTSIAMGSNLNRGGQIVADQIKLARQEAVSKNREVEVWFLNLAEGTTPGWRGMLLVRVEENGTRVPAGRITTVPEGILISTNSTANGSLSPLLMATNSITTNFSTFGNLTYRAFRFRANGSASALGTNNFLTLQQAAAPGSPPPNYYTIQVNPVTGKVTTYRP